MERSALPIDLAALRIGDELPPLVAQPVSRQTLALYAGASGDHNPQHIDIDQARLAGMHDVVAPGMLIAAYLGRVLTSAVPQSALRRMKVRFAGVTQVGDRIECRARVTGQGEGNGERQLRLEIRATNAWGDIKLEGDCWVAIAAADPPGIPGSPQDLEFARLGHGILAGDRAELAVNVLEVPLDGTW